MTDEVDTAVEHVAAAIATAEAGPARTRPSRPAHLTPDTPEGHCTNCGTKLEGPVCHRCGQVNDVYHRPVWGLLSELLEGLFALDGRVSRTVPALMVKPGQVTRDFLKGQRARFIPPFRLYIFASLIFFLLVSPVRGMFNPDSGLADAALLDPAQIESALDDASISPEDVEAQIVSALESGDLTQEEANEIRAVAAQFEALGLSAFFPSITEEPNASEDGNAPDAESPPVSEGESPTIAQDAEVDGRGLVVEIDTSSSSGDVGQNLRRALVPEEFDEPAPDISMDREARTYLADRLQAIADDPQDWIDEAWSWVPRVMFVMVPVYALLLGIMFMFRRGFFYFDHLIVSLHLHSALFLAMSVLALAGSLINAGLATMALLIYANAYLYRMLRVVYERSRFGSVLRVLLLDFIYLVLLLVALITVLVLSALV